jgi:hypothetical protein
MLLPVVVELAVQTLEVAAELLLLLKELVLLAVLASSS